jgi:3-deoxy-D-manno-octulosonic-acid transferase
VAFVGGSLIPHGGQNPIEAVHHDAAVLTGPSTHNFTDAYEALFAAGGAVEIRSADELAAAIADLAVPSARSERMRASARHALRTLSGALERTIAALSPLLPSAAKRAVSGG